MLKTALLVSREAFKRHKFLFLEVRHVEVYCDVVVLRVNARRLLQSARVQDCQETVEDDDVHPFGPVEVLAQGERARRLARSPAERCILAQRMPSAENPSCTYDRGMHRYYRPTQTTRKVLTTSGRSHVAVQEDCVKRVLAFPHYSACPKPLSNNAFMYLLFVSAKPSPAHNA